jgi:hypothetical protein
MSSNLQGRTKRDMRLKKSWHSYFEKVFVIQVFKGSSSLRMRGNHKNANSGGNSKIPRTTESEKLKLT